MRNLVACVIVVAHWFNIYAVKCALNDFNEGRTTTVDGHDFQATSTQALFEEYTQTEATTTAFDTTSELTWSTDSQLNATSYTDDPEWTTANLYDTYCRPDLCLRYDRFGQLVSKKHVACGFNGSFSDTCHQVE
ncbi:AGAP000356-PA-like protein [Anopheles sinensis]|uniref:AGAP000356-PA-like protein n=1 Tax=Anopheles sinensis TaxID=74873 RepID=A0A084VFS4_ANOSI|nr:AGAP000356-PA-like protein [Anopheles sinensis]